MKSFLVRQALRKFRRGSMVRDGRRPVSYELHLLLGEQLDVCCFSNFEAVLFRLAFSLAFFGAFRISELVAPSQQQEGGLLHRHVQLKGSVLECLLWRLYTERLCVTWFCFYNSQERVRVCCG